MPAPRWLDVSWKGCRACGRGCSRLLRWTLWLVLLITAGLQTVALVKRELRVPQFILREIETELAQAGLRAEFGGVTFDPEGRLLIRDVSLTLQSMDTRIMRARALYLQINPWALGWREVDVQSVEFAGVNFFMPAALSPSGQDEAIIRELNALVELAPNGRSLVLPQVTAAVGPFTVAARGTLPLPDSSGEPSASQEDMLSEFSKSYLGLCRQFSRILPQLPELVNPHLKIDLRPTAERDTEIRMTLRADRTTISEPISKDLSISLHQTEVRTSLTIASMPQWSDLKVAAARIEVGPDLQADQVRLVLSRPFDAYAFNLLGELQLHVGRLQLPVLSVESVSTQTSLGTLPMAQAEIAARIAGEPWRTRADLDLTTGAGVVATDGFADRALLDVVAAATGIDIPAVLSWEESPWLQTKINLGPAAKVLNVDATFATGPVVARKVPLDATSARVTWDGRHIRADNVVLRRGASLAQGSYEMDTSIREFQFLLHGHLQPPDIAGWFRDWWPRFWAQFEFRGAPPNADVEVSGRWGDPLATRVFVAADATNAVVRQIEMERMRTRVFVRPGWADVLRFIADRDVGTVQGRFARQSRLPDGRRWTRFEVDASGVTDLSPVPHLLPVTGGELIAPFDFTQPLKLSLQGGMHREDLGAPVTKDFTIHATATGPWRFYEFPLEDLDVVAHRDANRLRVPEMSTRMAAGELSGRLELSDQGAFNQLAFDLNLEEASLGRTIRDVATWLAQRRGEAAPDETEFQKQMAEGLLTLSLTAEGPSNDPFSLQGAGSAAVSDANLANINLLGLLSALLQKTILNFSTLQLSHAHANFELEGPRIVFPEVKVTGRRGAMNASGEYSLTKRQLDFNTKVRPFEGGEGLLDAVFSPLSSVLEVKLTGELADPAWTFVYGPTNLLRNLTGENARNRSTPDSVDATAPPEQPYNESTVTPPPSTSPN